MWRTREGFDVYLGGRIAGRVHFGLPYRLGVDADQLPQMIEGVVREYYLKHRAGQTFSPHVSPPCDSGGFSELPMKVEGLAVG
jgi:hypothetical protein